MKYYMLDNYKKKDEPKKIDKKKILKTISIIVAVISLGVITSVYIGNAEFRGIVDKYVLGKEITENTGAIIEIPQDSNVYTYAYDKYILVLNKNNLRNYSSRGKEEFNVEINISEPIFASNNRFLAVAEQKGNKLYLISGENILWQKDLEGQITKVNVNKNGYISVIETGTSYKTVIRTFDLDGNELPKVFRSNTYAIDTDISHDNKYLAIAEINSSKNMVQSTVKIISLEKAQTDSANAEVYSYSAQQKQIIINIKYQDKNRLMCMFDDKIMAIEQDQIEEVVAFEQDLLFVDIEIANNFVQVFKKSSGLFSSESQVEITNAVNKKVSIYKTEGLPKEVKTYNNIMALNLGTEAHFITSGGWLTKKYTSTRDIKNIIVCENVAGIVYKDKIELVGL